MFQTSASHNLIDIDGRLQKGAVEWGYKEPHGLGDAQRGWEAEGPPPDAGEGGGEVDSDTPSATRITMCGIWRHLAQPHGGHSSGSASPPQPLPAGWGTKGARGTGGRHHGEPVVQRGAIPPLPPCPSTAKGTENDGFTN